MMRGQKFTLPPEFFAGVALALHLLLMLVLSAWQPPAWAQTASSSPPMQGADIPSQVKGCTPNTWATPDGNGSPLLEVKTDKARGYFGWCRQPTPVGGDPAKWYWQVIVHQWCITKPPSATDIVTGGPLCIDAPKAWDYGSALRRVMAANNPDAAIAQIRAEFAAASVGTTDPQQLYERARLLWEGCKAVRTAPYQVMPIGLVAFDPPGPSPSECGDAPTPPVAAPPPTAVYVVTGAQAFAFDPAGNNGAGVRSVIALPTPPTKGATCDCATPPMPFMQFGARFCYVSQLVVAGCSLKK